MLEQAFPRTSRLRDALTVCFLPEGRKQISLL